MNCVNIVNLSKVRVILMFFVVIVPFFSANSSELPSLRVSEERIRSRDYAVIEEVAEAGGVEGLQRLISLAKIFSFSKNRELYPEVSRLALEAIKDVDGHGELFREAIEKLTKAEWTLTKRERVFSVLGEIDSNEVIDILIEYLDDDRIIESRDEIRAYLENSGELPLPFGANQNLAAKSLSNLKLEGAPVGKGGYGVAPLHEWLRWKEGRRESPIRVAPAPGERGIPASSNSLQVNRDRRHPEKDVEQKSDMRAHSKNYFYWVSVAFLILIFFVYRLFKRASNTASSS